MPGGPGEEVGVRVLPGGRRAEVARPASLAAAVASTPIPHLPYPPPLLPGFEISRESLSAGLGGERTREVLPFQPHRLVSGHPESVFPLTRFVGAGWSLEGGGQYGQGPWRMGGLPFPAPGLPAGSLACLVLTPPSFTPRRPCRLQEAQGPATFLEPARG